MTCCALIWASSPETTPWRSTSAPPGYVGHEDGGQYDPQRFAVNPYRVLLFDEIEAHPDVLKCCSPR